MYDSIDNSSAAQHIPMVSVTGVFYSRHGKKKMKDIAGQLL